MAHYTGEYAHTTGWEQWYSIRATSNTTATVNVWTKDNIFNARSSEWEIVVPWEEIGWIIVLIQWKVSLSLKLGWNVSLSLVRRKGVECAARQFEMFSSEAWELGPQFGGRGVVEVWWGGVMEWWEWVGCGGVVRNAAVHRNWNQRPEIREEMYAFLMI